LTTGNYEPIITPINGTPMNCPAPAIKPAPFRSVATNDPRRLAGVDRNSSAARRFRDLVEDLTAELGGDLSPAETLQVRNAATLQLHSEELAAKMVRGEPVDPEEVTRAANGATRAIAGLRRRKVARQPQTNTPTLDAYRAQAGGASR
jgi:hypothetical protein